MPDQPDDPLNYEMKIPPDPDKLDNKHEETSSKDSSQPAQPANDTGVAPQEEKPGSVRRSG